MATDIMVTATYYLFLLFFSTPITVNKEKRKIAMSDVATRFKVVYRRYVNRKAIDYTSRERYLALALALALIVRSLNVLLLKAP